MDYEYGATASVNNGNVTKQTITVPGLAQPFVQTYSYDELNRIATATETNNGSQTWTQTFGYDRFGNRNITAGTGITGFSFNGNKITAHTYDDAGNTTSDGSKTFTYDAENKQTLVNNGSIGEYFYDGDGKRVKKYVPGTGETTIFVYDAGGKLVAEYSTLVASQQDAKVAYLTNDHLGSPRINTDQNGAVTSRHDYRPFGEEILIAQRTTAIGYAGDTVRKQFTGYEKDNESELSYAETRYHAANAGRFLSPDDFANDSQVADPSSWNKFVYVRNSPLKYVDDDGRKATIIIETDEKNKTVKVKISASIAFYGEKGISMKRPNEAAKKAADNIAKAWAGKFEKDGMSVTVDTEIAWATKESKAEAESLRYQNVIGFVDGDADGSADSRTWSGGFDILGDVPDRGRWNINSVDSGVPQHEFGHLLGVWDVYKGDELINTNLLSNPSNSARALGDDFDRALGGEISSHREESRRRVAVGRQWETVNASPSFRNAGDRQNHNSTRILRAGRIFWN